MATGKSNARWIRVYVDNSADAAQDISADVSNVSGAGLDYETSDVTGYSDGVKNFTIGHPSSEIEITGPFDNTATTGAHTVFTGIAGSMAATRTLTVQIGIRAAPTTGDPEFEGEYYCSKYVVGGDGTYSAMLVPASGTAPAWGSV